MLRGRSGHEELAGASAIWNASDRRRAGDYSDERWAELETCVARSAGHCGVLGTASTMAIIAEAMGLTLPGSAAIPAVDSRRAASRRGDRRAHRGDGARGWATAVDVLTEAAFRNAITVLNAVSGSTNAVIHLLALAGRVGVPLAIDTFDEISRTTPWIVDVRPAGEHQMEEFFYAGGVPAVLQEIAPLLELEAATVSGSSLATTPIRARTSIPRSSDGARSRWRERVVWRSCAGTSRLTGRSSSKRPWTRLCGATWGRPSSSVTSRTSWTGSTVLTSTSSLTRCLVQLMGGPVGAPGMPEWGQLPIPAKLWQAGVRDMVRISDARMSGTAYGTCVLHVAPESAVGGPLAFVRDGDLIELDVDARRLELRVDDEELAARRGAWTPPTPRFTRGYGRLYIEHVRQADSGADLDFLEGGPGVDWEPYEPTSH